MSQTDPMIQYWALRLWDKFRVEEMYEELEAFRDVAVKYLEEVANTGHQPDCAHPGWPLGECACPTAQERAEEFALTLRCAGCKPDNEGETDVEPEASGAEGPLESLV